MSNLPAAARITSNTEYAPIRNIASRRELFVDDWLIEEFQGTALKLHSPTLKEIAFEGDGGHCHYATVFQDEDVYRAYYRGHVLGRMNYFTCYAESKDGIRWEKPPLGLVEHLGTRANNIIWDSGGMVPLAPNGKPAAPAKVEWAYNVIRARERARRELHLDELGEQERDATLKDTEHPGLETYSDEDEELIRGVAVYRWGGLLSSTTNFTPFKDTNPNARPDEKYKAVGGSGPAGLFAMGSPDGIHWHFLQKEPIIIKGEHPGSRFDSQNLAFWDSLREEYVAFTRDVQRGKRAIRRSTSTDFLNWTDPEWIQFQGDVPDEHLYTNGVIPYFRAPHIYLAFPRRFVPFRKFLKDSGFDGDAHNAISDQVFMSSRDGGKSWNRHFMEAFLRQGPDRKNWSDRNGTIAWGLLPTAADEISLYWTEHFRFPSCRTRRGVVRMDGFVSVNAPYRGGEFLTKPFRFEGRHLFLNYATSAVGGVQIEVQDEQGHPLKGFELNDVMYGDEIEGRVAWEAGSDLGALAGQAIRLRFVMKDADVYALRFGNV